MSYLYGDSTPSTLEMNYIEFVRDAVDFCVQVLLADQRMVQARARTRQLEQTTTAEIARLEQLGATVEKAIAGVSAGAADSSTAHCAAAIVRATAGIVRTEMGTVQAALAAEEEKRDAQGTREREGSLKELERLLVKHDLPDMTVDTQLALAAGGRYQSRARVSTAFGLTAMLELDIPAGHLYAQLLRLDRLVEHLDVQTPEMSGWLHKEVKLKQQHLEKHHLIGLSVTSGQTVIKLRLAPDGTGVGFDIVVGREAPRVHLLRVDERGGHPEPPFEAQEGDAAQLLALQEKLAAGAAGLGRHRRAIVEAALDGESLRSSDKATVLVEKLIATMAPVVQEIAARSQSAGELVLRRLLADDRREEVFMSKDELRRKLEPLGEGNRTLFDRLLQDGASRKEHTPSKEPAPSADRLSPNDRPTIPPPAALPARGTHPTPISGVVSAGAIQLPHALPPPTGAQPQAEAPRGTLKAKLAAPMLPIRQTPTNPGPAIAPAPPVQLEASPLGEPLRQRIGTPLSGIPAETAPAPTSPNAAATEASQPNEQTKESAAKEIEPARS